MRLLAGVMRGETGRIDLALEMARCADIVRLPVPGKPRFFLSHPDDLKHVLQTERARYRKSRDYRVLGEFMGQGLVTSEEPRWSADRKLLQPPFLQAAAVDFRPVMQAEVERVSDNWRKELPIDVFAEMMRLTIAVIGQRLFGVSLAADAERIRTLIHALSSHVFRRSQAIWDVAGVLKTPAERRARKHRDELAALLAPHIKQGGPLSVLPEGAVDQAVTIFSAGYDTTGNALGWCLNTLAHNQALQDEMAAGGDHAALIKETLRHFPTVPGVGRQAIEDDRLGDVAIPKGSTLMLFIYGMHHREDFWPSPDVFDPSRFSGKAGMASSAYYPFGAGPRVCIGSHFATQEMSVALAHFLPRYRFSPVDEPRPVPIPGLSLAPSVPVHLRVERRL